MNCITKMNIFTPYYSLLGPQNRFNVEKPKISKMSGFQTEGFSKKGKLYNVQRFVF